MIKRYEVKFTIAVNRRNPKLTEKERQQIEANLEYAIEVLPNAMCGNISIIEKEQGR